jgi:hypothetical protein
LLLAAAVVLGATVLLGLLANQLYPNDWQPIEATVTATRIDSTRPGTLQWSLIADASYEVAGRRYETTQDVFRDDDRSVTEAEVPRWPSGRTFTLYIREGDPSAVSLYPDGGREAVTVTAVLLAPLVVFTIGFAAFLIRRRRSPDIA